MTEIRPAATVVLLRLWQGQLQVLMLRRNSKLDFAGGSWVFPGGRVDAEELAGRSADAAAELAAVRETREETGLDISGCELLRFAHWTTPEGPPKRYATWFFMTEFSADDSDAVEVDGSEIEEHCWQTPAQVLERFAAGEIEMMPPTYITLQELLPYATPAEALSFYRNRPEFTVTPKPTFVADTVHMLYLGDAGYSTADPEVEGKRHRMVLTPGAWQYLCSNPAHPTAI